jgi:hypothetical protein
MGAEMTGKKFKCTMRNCSNLLGANPQMQCWTSCDKGLPDDETNATKCTVRHGNNMQE